jgi:hypothetical protein
MINMFCSNALQRKLPLWHWRTRITLASAICFFLSPLHAYGSNPQSLLIFGADGQYALQIYRDDRSKFASDDKKKSSPDEYKDASVGASCHFGHYTVDAAKGTITFKLNRASFVNWDRASQTRPFTLKGDDLEWHAPATPDGKIPISEWHRVQ